MCGARKCAVVTGDYARKETATVKLKQDRIVEALRAGRTVRDIADSSGLSYYYVSYVARANGFSCRNKLPGTSTLRVVSLLLSGMRPVDVADEMSVSIAYVCEVRKAARKAGIEV